jgi:dihydroorotate dehydrogenase electron transfer subunit
VTEVNAAVLERGVVTLREELMPGVWLLRLHSPQIARAAEPGQFVHIQCAGGSDPLLRRPFSFCNVNVDAGTYDLLFNVVGDGTAILAAAEAGQAFEALGPLGRAFRFPASGTLMTVGGGLGIAPFPFVARRAFERGLQVLWVNGAYTAHQLFPRALPDRSDVHLCTDDGSIGHHGFVSDITDVLIDGVDMVHACGPMPMLVALARQLSVREAAGQTGPPCDVSLEAPMGCALGTCLGCVVPASDGGYARVCIEGAVMNWRQVDWARVSAAGELVHHRMRVERLPADATVGALV